jgi:ADP-L-glycero-D-manno-heptose 6-epimerase
MILVTGGAGFIGSNLVHALNRRGEREVVIVDRLDASDRYRNLGALDLVDYLDHGDDRALAAACDQATAVFHLGANTDTTDHDGRAMVESNFTFAKRLLHRALERRIPFVYASSASVYGDGTRGFTEDPACESALNVYAASKRLLDAHVRSLLPSARSPVVGVRYFNVYGPQEGHKGPMASVAFHLFHQLRQRGVMELFEGSRDLRRDLVHVADVVAVTLALRDLGVSGIFNCGTGQARSFLDVAGCLRALEGGRGEIAFIPFPEALRGRYQSHTQADLGRLRAAGCDHAFLSLEEGMRQYHEVLVRTGGYLER